MCLIRNHYFAFVLWNGTGNQTERLTHAILASDYTSSLCVTFCVSDRRNKGEKEDRERKEFTTEDHISVGIHKTLSTCLLFLLHTHTHVSTHTLKNMLGYIP